MKMSHSGRVMLFRSICTAPVLDNLVFHRISEHFNQYRLVNPAVNFTECPKGLQYGHRASSHAQSRLRSVSQGHVQKQQIPLIEVPSLVAVFRSPVLTTPASAVAVDEGINRRKPQAIMLAASVSFPVAHCDCRWPSGNEIMAAYDPDRGLYPGSLPSA